MSRKPNHWHACAVGLLLGVSSGLMAQVAGQQPPPNAELLSRSTTVESGVRVHFPHA